VRDDETLWLPAGPHAIEPAASSAAPRLLRLNADLQSARIVDAATIEFSYVSSARAIAILDRAATFVEIDGERASAAPPLILPRGQHLVRIW
jgi:hypothetical protein